MRINPLKLARLNCGLRQIDVSLKLGVSEKLVSQWETGRAEPTTDAALFLARLYGVDAGELFPGRFGKLLS